MPQLILTRIVRSESKRAGAIALDVREAYGDHLASTFFNVVVER